MCSEAVKMDIKVSIHSKRRRSRVSGQWRTVSNLFLQIGSSPTRAVIVECRAGLQAENMNKVVEEW
ncbi:hypothetical protein Tsubulata_049717 [Turnera subulata]|uniref:Uncharacterized protein n=1 Tax=Turnera subulata TaxID=218843 RepID=A0A9Q0FWD9_9ROSI|nr:hypothetical protein Tsubulata_049717 [Turnera subulata]